MRAVVLIEEGAGRIQLEGLGDRHAFGNQPQRNLGEDNLKTHRDGQI